MTDEEAQQQFLDYVTGKRQERPQVKVSSNFRLEKFDGDHVEGDGKLPVEIIEGGDTRPFRKLILGEGGQYHEVPGER